MNEYDVSFAVLEDGSILSDVHGSTGTSRYARFGRVEDLLQFFSSLGIHEEKVAELQNACLRLQSGEAYHESMYLPEFVIQEFEKLATPSAQSQ